MAQTIDDENQFVVDLLTTLRNEKFSAPAWVHFLQRSWEMACATAAANPSLKRSWAHTTLLISMLVLVMLGASFIFEGPHTALRLLPGFLFCAAWQQSDLFWHLGLNRQKQTGKLLPVVGVANTLTWVRGLGAAFLLGRLVGGVSSPSWLALLVLLAPERLASFTKYFNTPLLIVTLILLIAAPLAQFIKNIPKGEYA